ncbi:hypothetical protein [Glycomyces paridis]|uniref:Uncharacterized protein n=1 Tax=Glycomyces paridis TaxID=2126555 RepID=A0A4S8PSV9_9ACTN|nr:hypothetical protein [Glycomyces paridis]THV31449.1 hypothetical protein E9998_03545 [Glycomyces paridis]
MKAPDTVRQATLLWATAVAAGIVETVLAVSEIAMESSLDSGVYLNIGLRSAVYIGAAVLIAAFAGGRRWARASLAVLLSVIGLGAMVVPSAMHLYDGAPLIEAVGGDGRFALAFFVTRSAHIAAVLIATGLMFSPSANRHFRKRTLEPAAA